MSKTITTASWIGKAAYEIIQGANYSGKSANRLARGFAANLLDWASIWPRSTQASTPFANSAFTH